MLKSFKAKLAGLIIPILGLLSTNVAYAQVEPNPINISGNRSQSAVSKEVFIPTKAPINNVKIYPVNVQSNDGITFPKGAITPQEPVMIQSNQAYVPIQFNLRNANSGEFTGRLLLIYGNERTEIPISIRVKDPWFVPVLILFSGTALGIMVSVYRDKGKPKDEVLVRMGRLRAQVQEDPEWEKAKTFPQRMDTILLKVKIALEADDLEEAIAIVKQAENIWKRWIDGRGDWLALLDYSQQLLEQLQAQNIANFEIQALIRELKDAINDAPDAENPDFFRDRLQKVAEQTNQFLLSVNQAQLNKLLKDLPADQAEKFKPEVMNLNQKIKENSSLNLQTYSLFQGQIEKLKTKMTTSVNAENYSDLTEKGVLSFLQLKLPIAFPPVTNSTSQVQQVQEAGLRLQVFTLSSYAIAIIFLAGAGFSQLYVDNPTFGANPWKDYFGLMAWGFGAEATRDAITKVIQSWELPGLK